MNGDYDDGDETYTPYNDNDDSDNKDDDVSTSSYDGAKNEPEGVVNYNDDPSEVLNYADNKASDGRKSSEVYGTPGLPAIPISGVYKQYQDKNSDAYDTLDKDNNSNDYNNSDEANNNDIH